MRREDAIANDHRQVTGQRRRGREAHDAADVATLHLGDRAAFLPRGNRARRRLPHRDVRSRRSDSTNAGELAERTERRTATAEVVNPTTSFLTATTLIYAIGAGITAAAGTRLALQSILVNSFTLFSFRLRGLGNESRIVIFRHYLPVPGVGNLRACCLPWMW